ncbi:hypothetical protein CJ305_06010 [Leeuwenhoekiella nanhaiensis]|uniref:Uncharacterized protein n=1 Tax=Leeuwenhoekiella nanhaiensis TaxID=1655491 RepID=A0A2G1VUP9_9FLAO|nr:hypothetical protein CJ305_06010 [Leeuwenhoekiella nanhaiensis]
MLQETISILFVLGFILLILSFGFRFFGAFYFYYSDHLLDAIKYCESQNLILIELSTPDSTSIKRNPFKRNNRPPIAFPPWPGTVFIDHKVLICKSIDDRDVLIWRQTYASIFGKNRLKYKIEDGF